MSGRREIFLFYYDVIRFLPAVEMRINFSRSLPRVCGGRNDTLIIVQSVLIDIVMFDYGFIMSFGSNALWMKNNT
jgi:hypothetical protein